MLDIQKLAAEMGLNCITTYKLDALKSVCPKGESIDMTPLCSREDISCLTIQNLEPLSLPMETLSTNDTDGLDTNHSEKHKYLVFAFFMIHNLDFMPITIIWSMVGF